MDSGSVRYIVDDHSSSCDVGVLVGGGLGPTMVPNSSSVIEAPVFGSGTSPFIIVPFVGSSGGGVSLRPQGALPKPNHRNTTKIWNWDRWSSGGYTDYHEKVRLFGDVDPNPASHDSNDPTVGYINGFDIEIGELGNPRDIENFTNYKDVGHTDESILRQIEGPFYSVSHLKRSCDVAFGNRFLIICSNGVKGEKLRGYLKNFTCQGCKSVSSSSCKFRLQYEVFIDSRKRLCLMLKKCINEHVDHVFTKNNIEAIFSSGGAFVPERLEALGN